MQKLLRESLAAGGMGFSSAISPRHFDGDGQTVPSVHASREELIRLAGTIKDYEGTALEFLPVLGKTLGEDQRTLMADLSLAADRPLNWNVLRADLRFPEVYRSQMAASDYAASRGARVVPLVEVEVIGSWQNFLDLARQDTYPGWREVVDQSTEERKRSIADPKVRQRMEASARWPKPRIGSSARIGAVGVR